VGIGNVGSALLMYKGFLKQNYKIVAAFDMDPVTVVGHISEKMGNPSRFSTSTGSRKWSRRAT